MPPRDERIPRNPGHGRPREPEETVQVKRFVDARNEALEVGLTADGQILLRIFYTNEEEPRWHTLSEARGLMLRGMWETGY